MIIKGVENFNRNLNTIKRAMNTARLEKALEAGAVVIEEAAQRNAPKGKTGNLRDSIGHEIKRVHGNKNAAAVVGPSREGFYGIFLEFGTRYISPRPWLRPAYESSKGEAERVAARILGDETIKVASRLRKK